MENLWFEGTNGKLYSGSDIIKAAYILNAFEVNTNEKSIIDFANECFGIKCQVSPSVDLFISHDLKYHAINYYYDHNKNNGCTLKMAKDYIDEYIKLHKDKNND